MSDEKITISMDEVERARPVPGGAPPPCVASDDVPQEVDREEKPRRIGLYVGIGIAVVALLCLSAVGVMAFIGARGQGGEGLRMRERNVSDYKAEIIKNINDELSKPDSRLKKRIEDAHLTVTVTSSRIVRCDVGTVDGTERTGKDDSNIAQVSLLIRFNWKGKIDTGYTDLRIVRDIQNDRLLKSEIEYTTALINTEDPELWSAVGALIGAALL